MVYKVEVSGEALSASAAGYLSLPRGAELSASLSVGQILCSLVYAMLLPFLSLSATWNIVVFLEHRRNWWADCFLALLSHFRSPFLLYPEDRSESRPLGPHCLRPHVRTRGNRMESASVVNYSIGML